MVRGVACWGLVGGVRRFVVEVFPDVLSGCVGGVCAIRGVLGRRGCVVLGCVWRVGGGVRLETERTEDGYRATRRAGLLGVSGSSATARRFAGGLMGVGAVGSLSIWARYMATLALALRPHLRRQLRQVRLLCLWEKRRYRRCNFQSLRLYVRGKVRHCLRYPLPISRLYCWKWA
jgi:hypothetical protein